MNKENKEQTNTKCGFVAVLGAPNAGKSTLVNKMVGAKVSIATHKIQTTRVPVRGIFIKDDTQVVLVDTPGIFQPKRRLDQAMVHAAWEGAKDADLILLLVDAPHIHKQIKSESAQQTSTTFEETERIIEQLSKKQRDVVLILNKIDHMERARLLELTDYYKGKTLFTEIFMISAENGDGVEDLIHYITEHLPAGPWLFDEDQISDIPMRMLASEITREKLMLRVHDELPYASAVETISWKQQKDGSIRIDQVIYVERSSQKGIVIGKSGRTIKEIGEQAREELNSLLETKVHLFLQVKVREKWSSDPRMISDLGLEMPKG